MFLYGMQMQSWNKREKRMKRCAARDHKLRQIGRGQRGSLDLCEQHKKKLVIISVRDFHSYWQIKLKTKLGGRESEWRQLSKANTSRGPGAQIRPGPTWLISTFQAAAEELSIRHAMKQQTRLDKLQLNMNAEEEANDAEWVSERASDKWKLFTHRYRKDTFKFL